MRNLSSDSCWSPWTTSLGGSSAFLQCYRAANDQIPLAKHHVSLRASSYIISDNGTNFMSRQVARFCSKCKITHRLSTRYYLKGNDQAKINNHTILDSMCKSLDKAKGQWVEKLLGVLWAYRTTKCNPTGETRSH